MSVKVVEGGIWLFVYAPSLILAAPISDLAQI